MNLNLIAKASLIAGFLLPLNFGSPTHVSAQTATGVKGVQNTMQIAGVVVDAQGEPVIGANITEVKDGTNGTISDFDGKFTLTVASNTTMKVSFIGYQTTQINVTPGNSFYKIVLKEDTETLDEVVVVGYGVMRKSDLTGSVGKMDINELKKVSTVDAAQAMQGRMAGVNVISNSGNPGSGATIRIRGIGTFNNSDPLYIVDGFPVNDISHISPTDIESMEVLKDASATAIYGSRGANGVILVKTKAGTTNKGSVEVQANAYMGISHVANKLELADATQFSNAYRSLIGGDDASFASAYPHVQYVLDQNAAGTYVKGTDWQKEISRPALSQRYNVSIQGSGENYNYSHGITYSDEQGIIKGSEMQKIIFHSNNNYNVSKKVKLGVNLNYVWYEKPGDGGSNDYYNGTLPGALRSDPISAAYDPYTDFYGEIYYSPSISNPALTIWQNGYNKTAEHRILANAYLQIDDIIFKGLSFRAQYGRILTFNDEKSFAPKYYITASQSNLEQTLYQKRYNGDSWSNTNYFSYNKKVSSLNINATLGMELQSNLNTDIWVKAYDVPEDFDLRYIGARKDVIKHDMGGGKGSSRLASGFFRTNFSWDNKYLLTATVRADGSSRFMSDERWGYFPSFSAGWNVSNEGFMQDSKISNFKVRAGWGLVGNQASAGEFDYVSSVQTGYNYAFNGTPVIGSVQEQLANAELTWESAEQYNIGIDYGFFNNKLNGSVDLFVRKTNDMILSRPIPLYAGKKRPNVNAGSMENRGAELAINYNDKIGDFSYGVNFNITYIKNEVTSLAGADPIRSGEVGKSGTTTKTEVGREIAYFYGYKTGGIFKTQADLDAHVYTDKDGVTKPIQQYAQLGDVKYLDLNGDGQITEADMTYLGSASPDFTGGLNINLGYKNFDITAFFNYSIGNEIVNTMYQSLYSSRMHETNISRDMALNHWTPENPNSNVPRLTKTDLNKNDTYFSDRWVEDGSYLKVKQIQIGYTLPKRLTDKAGIKNLRIYGAVDNLYTFTKYSGLDPELFGLYGDPFYYGVDMVTYPNPRTYSFGLNLTF